MKKLLLSVAVLATLALASCGSSAKSAEDKGAELKAKIENCTDPDSLKIYVQQAQEYAEQLVKEGKDQAAADYLNEVAPVLEAKQAQGVSILENIKNEADEAVEKAQEAADSVKAGVDNAVKGATEAVSDAKDKAAATAAAAVETAKDKATEAVSNAADATKAAADEAAQKAKDAAKAAFKK